MIGGSISEQSRRLLVGTAASLVGTSLASAVLGAAYWWLAARRFTTTEVGFAGASVSAMLLLGTLGTIGLGTFLMGELPRSESGRVRMVVKGVSAAGVAGGVLGLAGAALLPELSRGLSRLQGPVGATIFAISVGLTSASMVFDQASIGLWRSDLQLKRNVVLSVSKLAFLALLPLVAWRAGGLAILATWGLGIVASFALITPLARGVESRRPSSQPAVRTRFDRGTVGGHYVFNVGLQAPALALPVLVAALLTVRDSGDFYIAWMIAFFLFMVPISLSMSLYAVGSGIPESLNQTLRDSLRASAMLGGGGALVLALGARTILQFFGSRYAAGSTDALRLLAVAVFPQMVRTHYVALQRLRGNFTRALPVIGLGAALELCGATAGTLVVHSLTAFVLGWLAGSLLEAFLMLRVIISPALGANAHLEMSTEATTSR